MGILDKTKETVANVSRRNQELHIKLHITSGKKNFFLGVFENYVTLRVNDDGYVYFDDIEGLYKVSDFQWDGAMYEEVSTTTGKESTRIDTQTRGREKRTGRGIGATVGYLAAGPVGLAAGAMFGTGNKKLKSNTKGFNTTKTNMTTVNSQREVSSTAYMTLLDIDNNCEFSFGFDCDSNVYGELRNVFIRATHQS